MKSLVSIIVPVYNAETFLSKCIESIVQQDYDSIEILLVDDGSKDNSLKICQEFCDKHENVKVFSKKNTGVSDTRNYGIKKSHGKYICFVDSDDYLEKNYVSLMVKTIEKDNTDLVIASYNVIGDSSFKTDLQTLKNIKGVKNKEDILKKIINIEENNCIFGYIWRCLYKKDIIFNNKILFEKMRMSEDYLFLVEYINTCNLISVIDERIYNYRINKYSVTSKYISTLLYDMIYVNDKIYNSIVKNNKDLYSNYIGIVCNTYLCYIQNVAKSPNLISDLKEINENKKKYFYKSLKERKKYHIKFRKKLKISLFLFDLKLECLYIILFRIRRKLK